MPATRTPDDRGKRSYQGRSRLSNEHSAAAMPVTRHPSPAALPNTDKESDGPDDHSHGKGPDETGAHGGPGQPGCAQASDDPNAEAGCAHRPSTLAQSDGCHSQTGAVTDGSGGHIDDAEKDEEPSDVYRELASAPLQAQGDGDVDDADDQTGPVENEAERSHGASMRRARRSWPGLVALGARASGSLSQVPWSSSSLHSDPIVPRLTRACAVSARSLYSIAQRQEHRNQRRYPSDTVRQMENLIGQGQTAQGHNQGNPDPGADLVSQAGFRRLVLLRTRLGARSKAGEGHGLNEERHHAIPTLRGQWKRPPTAMPLEGNAQVDGRDHGISRNQDPSPLSHSRLSLDRARRLPGDFAVRIGPPIASPLFPARPPGVKS
jgi:hypothetical protein